MKRLKFARIGYLAMSVVFYIAGGVYMLAPTVPPALLSSFIGGLLIFYGVAKVVGYFSEDLYCLAFQYDLAWGILLIVLGIIVLIRQQHSLFFLQGAMGILILLDGLLRIQMAADAKRFGLEAWKRIMTVSVTVGVFGVLLTVFSYDNGTFFHIIGGCALIAEGVMSDFVVRYGIRVADGKRHKNDEIVTRPSDAEDF